MDMHPYKPRDRQEYDFEQLMRESILTGISQKELEAKFDELFGAFDDNT